MVEIFKREMTCDKTVKNEVHKHEGDTSYRQDAYFRNDKGEEIRLRAPSLPAGIVEGTRATVVFRDNQTKIDEPTKKEKKSKKEKK